MIIKNYTILPLLILATVISSIGCNNASAGMYSVETSWGKVVNVHPPGEWYTTFSPGSSAHDVNGKPWTIDIPIHTATKDNAPLKLNVRIQGMVDPAHIGDFFTRFGDSEKARSESIINFLAGQVPLIGRDAIVLHDAYNVFAEQEQIQEFITERLRPYMAQEMFCQLIGSVQITEKPIFDNPDIESAAGKVVAAQKLKEAAIQQKAAAQTLLEKAQIDNQIYTQSPQAFELAKLDKQIQLAANWASHSGGALVFGGSNLQIQVPVGK